MHKFKISTASRNFFPSCNKKNRKHSVPSKLFCMPILMNDYTRSKLLLRATWWLKKIGQAHNSNCLKQEIKKKKQTVRILCLTKQSAIWYSRIFGQVKNFNCLNSKISITKEIGECASCLPNEAIRKYKRQCTTLVYQNNNQSDTQKITLAQNSFFLKQELSITIQNRQCISRASQNNLQSYP